MRIQLSVIFTNRQLLQDGQFYPHCIHLFLLAFVTSDDSQVHALCFEIS